MIKNETSVTYSWFEILMTGILARYHGYMTSGPPEEQPFWAELQELKRLAKESH